MQMKTINDFDWYNLEDYPNEEWKDIIGYEGLYRISNYGRIKTLGRRRVREKIMRLENDKGYLRVSLSKYNKTKHYFVHYLVCTHFRPNIDNLPEINHKDENGFNNCVDNLEWCTRTYNICYGNRRDKVIAKIGKPVKQYKKDGTFVKEYRSIQDASRAISGNAGAICRCCQHKEKYYYGYQWYYSSEKEGGC